MKMLLIAITIIMLFLTFIMGAYTGTRMVIRYQMPDTPVTITFMGEQYTYEIVP